jgi:flagellar FliJ protein
MPQPFTLQPLLDLMQTRADEATRKLGQLIAAEQSQRSRLQMLEQYREEYAQRLRDATLQGITRLVLRNYQDFLARIDDAIEQQRIAVQNSELSKKAGQDQWQAQNKQLKAIDTLSNDTTLVNATGKTSRTRSCRTSTPPGNTASKTNAESLDANNRARTLLTTPCDFNRLSRGNDNGPERHFDTTAVPAAV